ncbi:cupredoxin domain-containing protein [Lolliginicoccus suaedae]|uniref:cupredoxin domain-containing protein n=1 Tax=Lolliginicoccus suaedae TaxID=2605429 RepID=UPI0011ED3C1B|nr:cupredoxin domain-containing protein [Lolliginicoccus suaedae]
MRRTILASTFAATMLLAGCGADDTISTGTTGTAASTSSVAATTSAEGETTAPATPSPDAPEPVSPTTTTQAPPPAPAQQADPVQRTVDIIGFEFEPGTLTVPVGSTITWVQKDDSLHTVDFTDGTESGDLTQGQSYSRTFTEPGTYDYVCFYHPRMTATVIVE